jgi:uncharacterized protein with HEPN domain
MGIGNVLRHEYQGLSDSIIWGVVIDELPKLKVAIEGISLRKKPERVFPTRRRLIRGVIPV